LRDPFLLLVLLLINSAAALGQSAEAQHVAPGVLFLLGDSSKGYSKTAFIEMADHLIVVDPNYLGRAHELLSLLPKLSTKPVKYVFDTDAHGDHIYAAVAMRSFRFRQGNSYLNVEATDLEIGGRVPAGSLPQVWK
jgi:glyoxylase-like metal-dependent hydrolase (beta-lactamase superfamily II)